MSEQDVKTRSHYTDRLDRARGMIAAADAETKRIKRTLARSRAVRACAYPILRRAGLLRDEP